MVSQDFSHCKICDFGVSESTSEIKNLSALNMGVYFAARYYRSPELALAYGVLSSSADIWALGITIAEMCGGRAVFRGRNNCELVWSIMSTLGPVPKEMSQNCKKAAFFGSKDAEYYNLYEFIPPGSDDAVTPTVKKLPKPEKRGAADRLLAIMQPVSSKSADIRSTRNSGKDRKMILDIRDLLLEKLLVLDPSKRMTAKCLLREEVVLSSVMDRDSHSQF